MEILGNRKTRYVCKFDDATEERIEVGGIKTGPAYDGGVGITRKNLDRLTEVVVRQMFWAPKIVINVQDGDGR